MNIFALVFLCGFFLIDAGKAASVSINVHSQNTFKELPRYECSNDTLLIKADSISSSSINASECSSSRITKVHVYVLNMFYIDSDLKLNGIEELQIFAQIWNVSRNVTFDLSGLHGANQQPLESKGEAGNPGNSGTNGGNFYGLAYELINGDFLTVNLNGGNGGDGQDGTASDISDAIFNGTIYSGDNGWFTTDLDGFYESYFKNKGYDAEIIALDDFTTFYAVFVHNKEATINVRLHPRKCCGTTGMGGDGGLAGQSGKYIFNQIGQFVSKSLPKFITKDGSVGKIGENATACESTALNVRIDTIFEKVVFVIIPLHYKFWSHLTIVDRVNSTQCPNRYVKSNVTHPEPGPPKEMKIVSAEFEVFLLENLENSHFTEIVQSAFNAPESNVNTNTENFLFSLATDTNELETN